MKIHPVGWAVIGILGVLLMKDKVMQLVAGVGAQTVANNTPPPAPHSTPANPGSQPATANGSSGNFFSQITSGQFNLNDVGNVINKVGDIASFFTAGKDASQVNFDSLGSLFK